MLFCVVVLLEHFSVNIVNFCQKPSLNKIIFVVLLILCVWASEDIRLFVQALFLFDAFFICFDA
jgi:hypothetical protein